MSDSLYSEPFVRATYGDVNNGVFVEIRDRPCFKMGHSKHAVYRQREIEEAIKICSASEVKRVGRNILCVSDNTVLAVINISYSGSKILLKVEYLHEGSKVKLPPVALSPEEYVSLADGYILPYIIPIREPIKHCGSEEKMVYPIHNKFFVVYKNGDIVVTDRIDSEVTLLPDGDAILPFPPKSLKEGVEILKNAYSHFREWAQHDSDKARLIHGLWAYLGVYWRYIPRRIPYIWAPRGTGKTTLLKHVWEMANTVTEYLGSPSGAAIRDILAHKSVIADDVDEHLSYTDEYDNNMLSVFLSYYYTSTIGRVSPETLKLKLFRLRGGLITAGSEPGFKFRHRAVARRLLVIGLPKSYGYFKYKIDSYEFNMALSLIGLADAVNSYEHNTLPEDPVNSVNVIFERYSATEPQEIGTKVEEGALGDPIVEVLLGLKNKIVKIANANNIDRYRFVKADRNGVFSECYIAIDATRIPRVVTPDNERVSLTVTKAVGTDKSLTVSETIYKRYFDASTVFAVVREYLKHISGLTTGYDKHGHHRIFIKYDCEKSIEEVRTHLLAIASDIDFVIKSLLNGKANGLDVIKA